jgi:hypothetical protein
MVQALVRHGNRFAVLVGAGAAAVGLSAAVAYASILIAIIGVGGAVVLYVLLKSYVELVAIIADMMLPK